MITSFLLEGFIPLKTSGVHLLELKKLTDVNLFISTNGSGKSTTIKEMHPFPPETSKFEDGGRKQITIRWQGKEYVMTSIMGKEAIHKFEIDGENLNKGGTATAQKMLAETHFGVDQTTCRTLSGMFPIDLFTNMSPARRKEYIMSLYPNNVDYVMGVFYKLKDEYNSLRGALKNQIGRYTMEKVNLENLQSMSETDLLLNANKLDDEIRQGLVLLGELSSSLEQPGLSDMRQQLLTLLGSALKTSIANPEGYTLSSLRQTIDINERSLVIVKEKQSYYSGLMAELSEHVSMQDIKQDPKQIEKRLSLIMSELKRHNTKADQLKSLLAEHPVLMEQFDLYKGYVNALDEFKQYLYRVEISSTPELTGGAYTKYIELRDKLSNEQHKTRALLEAKQHKLKHYLGATDITCPDCTHVFKVGISPKDIKDLQIDITGLTRSMEQYDTDIEKYTKLIENDAEWFNTMQSIMSFIKQQRSTSAPLFDLVKEYEIGKVESSGLMNGINLLLTYNQTLQAINPLMDEKEGLLERLNVINQNYMGGIIEKIKHTEGKVIWYNESLRLFTRKLTRQKLLLTQIEQYEQTRTSIQALLNNYRVCVKDQYRYRLKNHINIGVSERTKEKNNIMSEIIRNKSLTSVVESIDADIKRLKRRIKVVKLSMDGLCPNKGLIGKLMLDFIKTFCGNVNANIKEFSNIPLLLKPCNKANGDLTYKFPVINGLNTSNSDASECSAGESEIINFVSRKVGMRYKPDWFPLIMDEVGVYLDEINRSRFFNYVQQLMVNKDHQQLIMVSHYASQTNMFPNPNIIGIRYDGLTISGEVNTNTSIH